MTNKESKPNLQLTTPKKLDLRPVQLTNLDDVRLTFVQLTHRTCPHGFEEDLYGQALTALGFRQDVSGNYVCHVGTEEQQQIMFAAHLDDVSSTIRKVKHKYKDADRRVIASGGKTILGADDKSGVTILLHMLHHAVPGTYYLFVGEEVGCLGSKDAAKLGVGTYKACISFDRMGYDDVITHQVGMRTASDAFAQAVSDQLNGLVQGFSYKPCDGGVYTDSNSFADSIPECTNISVGYKGQHGNGEVQDILWLETLAWACTQVDWQSLPIERDPTRYEGKYGSTYWSGNWRRGAWDDDTEWGDDDVYGSVKDRADKLFDHGSLASYYATKYGTGIADLTMEEMLEIMDTMSQDELDTWAYSNVPKLMQFFWCMSVLNPRAAAHAAATVDKEVK